MRQGTPGFIGLRLKEAREARDLTAAALAELIGVTRAAISQYEGDGQTSPSPAVLRRISEVLNIPIQRFFRPVPKRDKGVLYNRCMASATKRARTRAERKYEWIREIAAFVSKYVRFPEARFPDLQMPSDPARISLSQVEDAASDCRKFFGNAAEPITNVAWLLETNGAVVARFEMHAATLDAFSEWAPGDARPYIMLSSDKQSAVRSRFDAAHELAHMVLHRHTPRELVGQKATFDLMEAQAHRFASAFLLPEDAFVDELYAPTLDAFLSLKSRWKVAISAMIRRSTDLRLINEEQAKHLWINLGRRRWRTREPLDDEIEPEVPRLLARSVKGLIDRQTISPGEIPFQIGLPPADVEQMLGLPANTLGHYPSEFDLPEEPLGGRDYPAVIRFPDAS